MPVKKAAIKDLKQTKVRTKRNTARKTKIYNLKKKLTKAIANSKKEEALKLLKEYYKAVDTARQKKTIHKNTAGRKKSRMTKRVNKLGSKK